MWSRVREALHHGLLRRDVLGEHHERLVRLEEVRNPRERGGQLAARGELAQVVEPHELLGAQRGGHLRVDRAQVERQRLEPGDHVALGEPVLVLVREQHRHGVLALGGELRKDLLLRAPHVAVRAQVPVQAVVAAGGAEAACEPRAAAEVAQPAEHAQLRDELLGAVQDRRSGEAEPERVLGQAPGQLERRLRPGRARVLHVVRLVEDQRARLERCERL